MSQARKATVVGALVLAAGMIFGPAEGSRVNAQDSGSLASAKATCKVAQTFMLNGSGTWTTLLSNTLKTSNKKDLFIAVSLVSALTTNTTVKSKNGVADTETADAGVEVRVLVDGVPAAPGPVVFAKRKQTLSATLQGIISGALTTDANGNIIIDPTLVTDEQITLILETMSANSFHFVMGDVASGIHRIEVQAMIHTAASSEDASAQAMVGPGSFTVESVRLIKGEDIVLQ